MKCSEKCLTFVVASSLLLANAPGGCAPVTAQSMAPPTGSAAPAAGDVQPAQQSPEELDQLVAPIALYPDALVAQILAGAADPTQIVEADRWLRQNSGLKGTELAQAVDKQPWDPSVKALIQFPSVLQNMDQNLAWTSALGEANENEPQAVLNAVQVMRRRAEQAGNLKSTSQQTVTTEGQTVVVQPANPEVVYVPEYDPWAVYGAPVGVYPYWNPYPGLYLGGPGLAFGLGIGIGVFAGFAGGWGHWGADWHGGRLLFDHRAYIAHSAIFRHDVYHGRAGFARASGFHGVAPHAAAGFHPGAYHAHAAAFHANSSAFHGFDHAGVTRAYADRGRTSFGGGFHAGGFHGGFHGGGRR
jgi:hypothetical protein